MAEILHCKYECGADFPNTPSGKAQLMNHYQWDCPKNPNKTDKNKKAAEKSEEKTAEKTAEKETEKETKRQEYITSESMLDLSEVLERIIKEVSQSKKTPGVIRMVENYLDDPKKSFKVLAQALSIADYKPSERKLILQNWAAYLKLEDVNKLIESTGQDEDQKKEEKKKEEEIDTGDAIDKEMEKMMKDELRQLQLLRIKKDRRTLEKELEEPKSEPKTEEEKHVLVVDGATLKLNSQELLGWRKYLSEEKEKQEEKELRRAEQKTKDEERRAEQKIKDEERLKKRDDDTVEWPIGDKVIKVRPETIPMLVMQQTQKKEGASDDMKLIMEEMKAQREQFHQFQMDTLKKENEELKAYASQDPLDRIYSQKEKLEKLGLVSGAKPSATERMYDMDRTKLDTGMKIILDKSMSVQNKVDHLLDTLGPAAQEYVKEMVLQMKQNRGVIAPEAPRTEQQATETLKVLEEVDKAMESKAPRVVSVEKTVMKAEQKGGT